MLHCSQSYCQKWPEFLEIQICCLLACRLLGFFQPGTQTLWPTPCRAFWINKSSCPIIKSLKAAINKELVRMSPDFMAKNCAKFRGHIEARIAKDGSHIEYIIRFVILCKCYSNVFFNYLIYWCAMREFEMLQQFCNCNFPNLPYASLLETGSLFRGRFLIIKNRRH